MTEKQYYHRSFSRTSVSDGDIYPVGGGLMGGTSSPYKINVNLSDDLFKPFFDKASKHIDQHKEHNEKWLNETAPDISLDLKAKLLAFTTALKKNLDSSKLNIADRNKLYDEAINNTVPLSEMFRQKHAMCTEFSLLAKRFLDIHGVESSVFYGDVLFNYNSGDLNLPRRHTFLVIKDKDEEYIWDPTNPIKNTTGPDVFLLLKPFIKFSDLEEKMNTDCLMVECIDVVNNRSAYYGVGDDGTLPEELFIHAHNDSSQKHDCPQLV